MPRTAATQDSNRLYDRHSAKLRAPTVTDSTPVLFRLPSIAQVLPTPANSNHDLPLPSMTAALQAVAPSESIAPKAETAVETAAQPSSVSQETSAASPSERSWWEHWSSGVVLILLIIALVAASIIAFNDTGSTDPDLLADSSDEHTSGPNGNLNGMTIPSLPTLAELSSQVDKAVAPTVAVELPVETQPIASAEVEPTPGNTEPEHLVQSTTPVESPKTELLANEPVAEVELLQPSSVKPNQSLVESRSSATLDVPVGLSSTQLELSKPDAPQAQVSSIPTSNQLKTPGTSPTLYDDALVVPNASASSNRASTSGSPIDTNQPTYPALLSASSAAPNVTTASQQRPAPQGMQFTATPESSADAIIGAWQQFHALNQAETTSTNRYLPPSGTEAARTAQSTAPNQY